MKLTIRQHLNNLSNITYSFKLYISSLFKTDEKKYNIYIRLYKFINDAIPEEHNHLLGVRLCLKAIKRIINKYPQSNQ